MKYRCGKGGNCVVTMTTRNMCKYCRYQKCLSVGMTPTGKWVLPSNIILMRSKHKPCPFISLLQFSHFVCLSVYFCNFYVFRCVCICLNACVFVYLCMRVWGRGGGVHAYAYVEHHSSDQSLSLTDHSSIRSTTVGVFIALFCDC